MVRDKELPVNIEAEKWVLGSVMLDVKLMHAARPLLTPEDFSLSDHQKIWRHACALYDTGKTVDHVTMFTSLRDAGDDQAVGGLGYLNSLEEGLPLLISIDSYIQLVKDKAVKRRIIESCRNVALRAMSPDESTESVLEAFGRAAIDLIPRESGRGLQSAAELIDEVGLQAILSPRKDKGLMFPWPWMNAMTFGMLPAELWVLAARTSAGKTSAMLQHALMAAQRGKGIAVFSLEVGKVALANKACYQLARIDSEKGKSGRLDADERRRLNEAASILHDLPIYFDTQCTTVMAIHAAVRQRQVKARVDHVIVDYLQLLGNTGRFGSRAEAVGANAWALKMLATDFQIPVLLLSQFKRFEKDREPELSDLKESGDIENHANGIWFIHRQSDEDLERVPVKFMLPKQRDGRRNPFKEFEFHTRYQRFEELATDDWSDR